MHHVQYLNGFIFLDLVLLEILLNVFNIVFIEENLGLDLNWFDIIISIFRFAETLYTRLGSILVDYQIVCVLVKNSDIAAAAVLAAIVLLYEI